MAKQYVNAAYEAIKQIMCFVQSTGLDHMTSLNQLKYLNIWLLN